MLNNATYNLLETASVISKGRYRYDTFKKDAKDCQQCQQLFDQMKKMDDELLGKMIPHMREHLDKDTAKRAA
jgi:hypothetical protein